MSTQQRDDAGDFFSAMKDVKPLKQDDKVLTRKSSAPLAAQLKREAIERQENSPKNYLSVEKVEPVAPYDPLSYKKDGVQQGVFKNLRLGKYRIESSLNLQQHKFEQARQALFATIISQHQKGTRTLLVRHGIGLHSKPFAAFLKSYVNQWLQQMPEVLAFHTAIKADGGSAAVYVLLKKNREEKQRNREQHRKR